MTYEALFQRSFDKNFKSISTPKLGGSGHAIMNVPVKFKYKGELFWFELEVCKCVRNDSFGHVTHTDTELRVIVKENESSGFVHFAGFAVYFRRKSSIYYFDQMIAKFKSDYEYMNERQADLNIIVPKIIQSFPL